MTLFEEKVRHLAIGGFDDQPLDFSDVSIRGVYVVAAAHLHFTHCRSWKVRRSASAR